MDSSFNKEKKEFVEQFRREHREKYGLTQKDIASTADVSVAQVSRWESPTKDATPSAIELARICRRYNWSSDHLLGLQTPPDYIFQREVERGYQWGWTEHIPPGIDPEIRKQLTLGVNVFHDFIDGKLPAEGGDLRLALKRATRSGALQLLEVPTVKRMEQELIGRFPSLKEALVARVPVQNLPDYRLYRLMATELVAVLAAREVLPRYGDRESRIALGGGYTMLRVGENASWYETRKFTGVRWIPTMTARYYDTHSHLRSANFISSLLASRYQGSEARWLPFIPAERRRHIEVTNPQDLDYYEQPAGLIYQDFRDADTALISIGGVDKGSPTPERFLVPADSEQTSTLRQILYRKMVDSGGADKFAGEVSSVLLDTDGNIIPITELKEEVYWLDLNVFRAIAEWNNVWLVTAGRHKADAIRMAIRTGIVNSLVIDEETADELLTSD